MLSCEPLSTLNTQQSSRSVARDRGRLLPQPRKSAHASYCDSYERQDTPPHHRVDNEAVRKPSLSMKEVKMAPQRDAVVVRIPPEVLGIIFEHCLDEQATSRAVLSEAPLLLGRVCRFWRSVVHRTPRLWTSLSFRFLETNVDRSRDGLKVATAIETWLHRSYPAPLSIAFTDHRIFQKDTEDVVIWLFSSIRMHAFRWKAIHLRFSSDYFLQLSMLSLCAFTSLTSFSVQTDHMGWRRSLLSLHFDLSRSSRLTSLMYTGPDHVAREDILVDWARLTTIALSYDLHESGGESTTFPRHFSSLALCQNLSELSIGLSSGLGQNSQGHASIPIIELPKLHTLRVRQLSRTAHACALLDALRLPQLSTLRIDSAVLTSWDSPYTHTPSSHPDLHASPLLPNSLTRWWHAHHLSALLDRSECHLHTLHIQDVDISPSELERLLVSPSTSPTLSTFTFEPASRAYPFLDVLAHLALPLTTRLNAPLTAHAPAPTPFPSLTRIRLGCAHERHLDPIADLIASRTGDRATHAGVQRLAVFELVFHDFVYSNNNIGHHHRQHGQVGWQRPGRKRCFDAFKARVLTYAHEGGVDVDIRVERPYEPVYISVL